MNPFETVKAIATDPVVAALVPKDALVIVMIKEIVISGQLHEVKRPQPPCR